MIAFRHMRSMEDTQRFLQDLREKKPEAHISVKCFHEEQHTETRTETDSSGQQRTYDETHYETVVTYEECIYLQITGFRDATPLL